MPMPSMPEEFDPTDPAEQGHYGEQDNPHAQAEEQRHAGRMPDRQPMMRDFDEDERQSER